MAAILSGCGNGSDTAEHWGEARQALNACDEAVPPTRAIDGIPAYAQCDAIEDGAIWSNNGVDTASSSQGAGWVRTQYSGGYQCTELARRYMLFRWDIDYQHGNAGQWCDGELPSTLALATAPTHGDLIVFAPGSCGADATTGHVAVVDTVDMAAGKVTIVEQNQASRRTTQQSCAKCFLHAVANDGSTGGAGGGAAGGGAAGGGAAGGGAAGGGAAGGNGAGGAARGGAGGAAQGGAGGAAQGGAGGAAQGGGASSSGAPTTGGDSSSSGGSLGGAGSASLGGSSRAGTAADGGSSSPSTSDSSADEGASCHVGRTSTSGSGSSALLLACTVLLTVLRRRADRTIGRNARES